MNNQAKSLKTIFAEHDGKVSDKWSIYLAEYDRLFQDYRNLPVRLLEIGIQNGGSLEIWSKFFLNAEKLVGCDINPACAMLQFNSPKIAVVVANANKDVTQQLILTHSSSFDLIIDDGSHQSGDIVRSFARYFTHLNDGGLYIAEDLHCSYWQDFEGGIFNPYSSIAFFKRLADTINHEHWGVDKTRCELLRSFNRKYNTRLDEITLSHIHSIEFINSMCVIRKKEPSDNVLGCRLIAGKISLVDEAPLPLHGSGSLQSDQSANPWIERDVPAEAELVVRIRELTSLNQEIAEREQKIFALNQTIAEREISFSGQILQTQQDHQQELNEQRRQQEKREQALCAELSNKQEELHSVTLHYAEAEKVQALLITKLEGELYAIRSSYIWRMSAPLRNLASMLCQTKLVKSK